MVLISKRFIRIALTFLGLLWIGYSIAGFYVDAETLLFLGLLGFLVLCSLVILGAGASRFAVARAKRLLGTNPDSPGATLEWQRSMGDLGVALLDHERRLIEGNWGLTHKIQAMNRLVSFLVRNFTTPILVTDVLGKIVYTSPQGAEYAQSTSQALVGLEVQRVFPEFRLLSILRDLENGLGRGTFSSGRREVRVYALSSKNRVPEYLLFTLDTEVLKEVEDFVTSSEDTLTPLGKDSDSLIGRIRQSMHRVFRSKK